MQVKDECEIITEATDYLSEPEHWTKGKYRDEEGRCCMLGAIRVATAGHIAIPGEGENHEAYSKVRATVTRVIGEREGAYGYDMTTWNDDISRTHDEVMEVMNATRERICNAGN